MKKRDHKILRRDKKNLEKRLERKQFGNQPDPMFKDSNIVYEISDRTRAIGYGGLGAIHKLVCRLKLDVAINDRIELLKFHVPYHESDHVLNIAYNVLSGGTCLEDIERLRNDEAYMNGLGATRIPDPTTAGDFLRRFDVPSIVELQETYNAARQKVWALQGQSFRKEGIIDVDGTIAGTTGECKQGMDIAYTGIWGYAPLIVSLANTNEVLYLVNRPGNRPSSDGAAEWIDRAISLVDPVFQKVWLRGDTDFSLTKNFDRWSERVHFVFGFDAKKNVVRLADELPKSAWRRLERPPRYEIKTEERARPDNVKEQIIREREYKNIHLQGEDVAEFDYRPTCCEKTYRMVAVRKNLTVEKGEQRLFDEIRYFFYITDDREMTMEEVVLFANDRCNQENVIAQLKSGVNALRMPSDGLVSNWAYMVIAALAWNLKAWYGLVTQSKSARRDIVRMEFKRFLISFIQLPCQIVNTGRRLVYRILTYSKHLETFFATFDYIKRLKLA
ncbi:MAG: IS1380 family transposase [Acidobacteria bacterium]|nr:IS1380 family transposase [Acidobacteriota bacterium]MBI3655521.1 IS1380 family transposase [Acidobacteriota bacterium]